MQLVLEQNHCETSCRKKLPGVKEVLTADELIPNEARNMRQGYIDGENLLINFLDLPTFPLPFHSRKLLR